jgi:translation elongation factor EF-G
MTACETAARDALGKTVSAELSQPFYLDVTHPEANKGSVATTLSKLHGHSARRDRHDRRHAQRRADVPQERIFNRHGKRQQRG